MLILASQAIEELTQEQKQILQIMVEPIRTAYYRLDREPPPCRQDLRRGTKATVIFTTIQDYLFEHEPSLRPPGWTNEQRGAPAPAMEGVIMGLFGILSASELANYRKVTKRGRRRR